MYNVCTKIEIHESQQQSSSLSQGYQPASAQMNQLTRYNNCCKEECNGSTVMKRCEQLPTPSAWQLQHSRTCLTNVVKALNSQLLMCNVESGHRHDWLMLSWWREWIVTFTKAIKNLVAKLTMDSSRFIVLKAIPKLVALWNSGWIAKFRWSDIALHVLIDPHYVSQRMMMLLVRMFCTRMLQVVDLVPLETPLQIWTKVRIAILIPHHPTTSPPGVPDLMIKLCLQAMNISLRWMMMMTVMTV